VAQPFLAVLSFRTAGILPEFPSCLKRLSAFATPRENYPQKRCYVA